MLLSAPVVGKEEKVRSANYGLLGVEREQWGPECDASERLRFDHVLEKVLAQLEPVCLSEQKFCVTFFQLDVLSPTNKVCLTLAFDVKYVARCEH